MPITLQPHQLFYILMLPPRRRKHFNINKQAVPPKSPAMQYAIFKSIRFPLSGISKRACKLGQNGTFYCSPFFQDFQPFSTIFFIVPGTRILQ